MYPSLSRILPLLILLAPYIHLQGQNLVLNPSFETFSPCPVGPSELDNAANWNNPFLNLIGDTCSTSDLFNACNFLGAFGVDVPANILGNEPARTGDGYAGIILSERITLFGCTSFGGSNWREYVHGQLSAPLVAGQNYCVTFYVSLADAVKYATDDIGVHFSNSPVSISCATLSGNGPLPLAPQLVWTGGLLTNASGWTELQWSYTAAGGEQFITIGNFQGDGGTTISCVNSGAFNPYAYYYIDDVSVVQGNCGVLPVELSYFEGTAEDGQSLLRWETLAEGNNLFFEVERSENGEDWEMVDRIAAGAQGKSIQTYSCLDKFPFAHTWYRLSQTDLDGTRRYIGQTRVAHGASSHPALQALYAMPEAGEWAFVVDGPAGILHVEVLDGQGRMVSEMDYHNHAGRNQHRLSLAGKAYGIYHLRFSGAGLLETKSIVWMQ